MQINSEGASSEDHNTSSPSFDTEITPPHESDSGAGDRQGGLMATRREISEMEPGRRSDTDMLTYENNPQNEHQVSANLSDSSNHFYINNSTCTIQHDPPLPGPLKNIVDSTTLMIKNYDSTKHVSTYAERSALKMLKRFGSIFIKGRSGTGKSRVGLSLLSQVSTEKNCTPLKISFAQEWNLIPKTGDKYIIMIDDIFGSSNLVQSQVDEWARVFDIMWPSVESGQILLVITSRPEISAQCVNKMKNYNLMKKIQCVTLDAYEFCLRSPEKKKMLRKLCGKITDLSESQIHTIIDTYTSLGFPQCCEFYASNRNAQAKGENFFCKPYECLKEIISTMKETDPLGYFVLQLVMLNKGSLMLDPSKTCQQSSDFTDLFIQLVHITNMSPSPNFGQIKTKAEYLCVAFLCQDNNKTFQFCHQSLFDAVFLEMAVEYPEMCIRVCSDKILLELVRIEDYQPDGHEVLIKLTPDMYDVLADRITKKLQSENSFQIWDHSILKNEMFLGQMMSKWSDGIFRNIMSKQHKDMSIRELDGDQARTALDLLMFSILMPNETLAQCIVSKTQKIHSVFTDSLILEMTIIENLTHLGNTLILEKGIIPDKQSFKALCFANKLDHDFNKRVLKLIPEENIDFSQNESSHLLAHAAINGNMAVARILLSKGIAQTETMALNCMSDLCMYLVGKRLSDIDESAVGNVITSLISCEIDHDKLERLAGKCSWHCQSIALKAILKKCITCSSSKWKSYMKSALQYGGHDGVQELLTVMPEGCGEAKEIPDFLFDAAVSKIESGSKVKLLLQHFAEVISKSESCEHSNGVLLINTWKRQTGTVLHVAALEGNTEAVYTLIQARANVNIQNGDGRTPLWLAAMMGHDDCVTELLSAGADVNNEHCILHKLLLVTEKLDICVKLIEADIDVNYLDPVGRTILFMAVARNDLQVVKIICLRGGDVSHVDNEGRNVMHIGSRFGDDEMIQYLRENGAKPILDNDGKSVLHHASLSTTDAVENLQYLVDILHVPVDSEDNLGRTALFPAVQSGDVEVVEFLLEKGANLKHRDKEQNTLLHVYSERVYTSERLYVEPCKMIKCLYNAGLDLEQRNKNNELALHCIIRHHKSHYEERLKFLLEKTTHFNQADGQGKTPLHVAAESDSVLALELLLEKGADICINLVDNDQLTPLDLAAKRGHYDFIKKLLAHGADKNINRCNRHHQTPLHHAVCSNNARCVELLLASGADRSIGDSYGRTSLHLAAKYGNYNSMKLLLEKCQSSYVNQFNNKNQTPLHLAVKRHQILCIELLLLTGAHISTSLVDNNGQTPLHLALIPSGHYYYNSISKHTADRCMCGYDISDKCSPYINTIGYHGMNVLLKGSTESGINHCDNDGNSPLHLAVSLNNFCHVKLLLDKGAKGSIGQVDKKGQTPLHLAVSCNNFELVQLLLEKGSKENINQRGHNGQTPLHLAVDGNHFPLARLLLENGADICQTNSIGDTPLHLVAKKYFCFPLVELLIEESTEESINQSGHNEQTMLHFAVLYGNFAMVQLLLKKGAETSISNTNSDGDTPLHLAAARTDGYQFVKLLLQKGTKESIYLSGRNGQTLLHLAVQADNFEIVRHLLENGADISISRCNNDGDTPLHLAAKRSYVSDSMQLLLQKGAKESVNRSGMNGQALLHLAVDYNNFELVKLLLQKGADKSITQTNCNGETPLHLAAKRGQCDCMKLLLESDSDININKQDNQGRSILHLALSYENFRCVHLVLQRGADTSLCDNERNTTLHAAAANWIDGYELVKLLLAKGAANQINQRNADGQTPLHVAAQIPHSYYCMKLMIENGADKSITQSDDDGNTPLHLATIPGGNNFWEQLLDKVDDNNKTNVAGIPRRYDSLKLLLDNGADKSINQCNSDGQSPVSYITKSGDVRCLKLLLENVNNACISQVYSNGRTLLHYAAVCQSSACLQFLLKNGCVSTMNQPDDVGETPLHCAAKSAKDVVAGISHRFDCLKLLLDNGADKSIHQCDNTGLSPVYYITESCDVQCLKLLLENVNDGHSNQVYFNEQTLLHCAIGYGGSACLKLLLENGYVSIINQPDKHGQTPLHRAAWHRDYDCLNHLLQNGADKNICDSNECSPLSIAKSFFYHNSKCVELLLGTEDKHT